MPNVTDMHSTFNEAPCCEIILSSHYKRNQDQAKTTGTKDGQQSTDWGGDAFASS